jgi:hypothetical protein
VTGGAPEFECFRDDRRLVLADRRFGVRLAFERWYDVWCHTLGALINPRDPLNDQGDFATALGSAEARPEAPPDSVPPSPSYQELHHDPDQDPRQVLLVGKFGPHHYSAVFALREEVADSGARSLLLDVDVADRCRTPAPVLACTYAVRSIAPFASLEGGAVAFGSAPSPAEEFFRIEAEPPVGLHVRPHGLGGGSLVQLTVATDPAAATHRLRYAIRLPAPGLH